MFFLFLQSFKTYLAIAWGTFAPGGKGLSWRRALVMMAFLPVFGLLQGLHWLGFLFDEIFFRGYRKVSVSQPLLVLGPPRSGTTLLHRVLAQDPQFTTFTTWECLFAPSVTQRRFWLALGGLDRLAGRPLGRLLGWLERRVMRGLDAIHATRLDAPEEDYLILLPLMACFILVLPFPFAEPLWRMGFFDRAMGAKEKERLLDYYRCCWQRHLYVHGPDKRLLSKNASFGPWVGSLLTAFPDARILCCMRDPLETVPSQLSSIRSGIQLFDSSGGRAALPKRMIEVLVFHYENLLQVLESLPPHRRLFLPMENLRSNLGREIGAAYGQLGIPFNPEFRRILDHEDSAARCYSSQHAYSLAEFGLDAEIIQRRFRAYYAWHETFMASSLAVKAINTIPTSSHNKVIKEVAVC